jgi:hypothetical protein
MSLVGGSVVTVFEIQSAESLRGTRVSPGTSRIPSRLRLELSRSAAAKIDEQQPARRGRERPLGVRFGDAPEPTPVMC